MHSSSFCLRSSSDSQCRSGRARGRFYVSEWPRVSPPSAPPKRFGSCCRPRGQIVSGRVLGTATDMCQLRLVGRPVRAPQHVIRASPNRDSEVICLSFSFQEAPKEFQSHDPLSLSNLRCALRLRPPPPISMLIRLSGISETKNNFDAPLSRPTLKFGVGGEPPESSEDHICKVWKPLERREATERVPRSSQRAPKSRSIEPVSRL